MVLSSPSVFMGRPGTFLRGKLSRSLEVHTNRLLQNVKNTISPKCAQAVKNLRIKSFICTNSGDTMNFEVLLLMTEDLGECKADKIGKLYDDIKHTVLLLKRENGGSSAASNPAITIDRNQAACRPPKKSGNDREKYYASDACKKVRENPDIITTRPIPEKTGEARWTGETTVGYNGDPTIKYLMKYVFSAKYIEGLTKDGFLVGEDNDKQ